MRRGPYLALILTGLLFVVAAWGGLVRIPEGGQFTWNADLGALRTLSPGWHWSPRWTWQRVDERTLRSEIVAPSREELEVRLALAWHPEPGEYTLAPAASAREGLSRHLETAVRRSLGELPAACLVAELREAENCPDDPKSPVAQAIASVLRTRQSSLRITLTAPQATVQSLALARIHEQLPEPKSRALVLGLDGLDWDFVLPLVDAGAMPNLEHLMEVGTWGRMQTLVPTLSPLLWTSMATGVSADRHGILDFVEKDPETGQTVPVTGRGRRVPAIWNIASALGRTVAVVGWWATWPAERVNGVMISDRLYYTLTQGLDPGALRGDPPEMIHPQDRTGEFTRLRDRAVRETDWQVMRHFLPISRDRYEQAIRAERGMEDPVDGFRRIVAATRTYMGSGLKLAEESQDLLMVYLEGTDTTGHLLARYLPPPTDPDIDAAEARLYTATVRRYFEAVDRWIGRYLQVCPLEECSWLVVSDHGFHWGENRPRGLGGFAGNTAPLWHDQDAAFVVAGAGVRSLGGITETRSLYDVTPTVAALLSLPAGASWSGSPLPGVEAADLEPLDYLRLVPPSSYRMGDVGPAPEDPEFLEQLQALGYLGDGDPASSTAGTSRVSPTTGGPTDAAGIEPETTRGELNNLAVLKLNQKGYDEAERLLEEAIRRFPDYPSPHYNLRRLHMETGRYDEADRHLWLAADKGLRDRERTIDRAARDYDGLGQVERAVALLEEAIRRYPDHEPFHVHLLVDLLRLGRCTEGIERGAQAAQRFVTSAPVHAFYGLLAGCAGENDLARREMERSLELNPDQPTLRQALEGL